MGNLSSKNKSKKLDDISPNLKPFKEVLLKEEPEFYSLLVASVENDAVIQRMSATQKFLRQNIEALLIEAGLPKSVKGFVIKVEVDKIIILIEEHSNIIKLGGN